MKLTILFLMLGLIAVSAESYSQAQRLNLSMKNASIVDVFNEIEQQSDFYFFFKNDEIKNIENVDVNSENETIDKILDKLLNNSGLGYKIVDKYIVISPDGSGKVIGQKKIKLSGKVTDKAGQPLPGVTVVVKGTTNGTITNFEGVYNLSDVPSDGTVQYSFVGMKMQEITVTGQTSINIVMEEDAIGIEEVVAIGYGEVRRRDLTGSVTKVTESENVSRQYNSVDAILQGRAAGVQVNGSDGTPGQGVSIRIRGTNSLSGNNEPLYVVDGIIISSAGEEVMKTVNDGVEYQAAQNGLTGINPKDIESIEILKDASATAIYGSRGANGVVLITTKQGTQKGDAKISVYSSVDFAKIAKQWDVMDAFTYAKFRNEYLAIQEDDPAYSIQGNEVYAITDEADPVTGEIVQVVGTEPLKQINWQEEIYKTAVSHNEGVTVSGSNDKTKYYFSAGYKDQQGIVDNSNLLNGDLRLNLSKQLKSNLKLDTRIGLNYQELNFIESGNKTGGTKSFVGMLLRFRPLISKADEDVDLENELSNPYAWLTDFEDKSNEVRVNGSMSAEYKFNKNLKYRFMIGMDYRNKERSRWYGLGVYRGLQQNGDLGISNLVRYSYTMNHLLSYQKTLNKIHRINATVGFTYDGSKSKLSNYEVGNFPIKVLRTKSPQAAQTIISPLFFNFSDVYIESALCRINYSLSSKYLLTATFRADGSSKFAEGHKWGYFPAAAFAWRLGEEDFIKSLNVFDNLKFRLGWGQTGSQTISAYSTLGTYSTGIYTDENNGSLVANTISRIANSDLTWETTQQLNIGFDLGFLNNRLTANIDAYDKITSDLLQNISIGPSNGFTTMPVNLGEISNRGIELSLNFVAVDKNDLSIELGGNIAFNRNKIKELGLASTKVWINGEERDEIYYLGNAVSSGDFKQQCNIFMEGQAIGMFWGYETNGIYQTEEEALNGPTFNGTANQAGDVVFIDQNGDGNINSTDKTFIGNPNPEFTYGFNINTTYKRFNISALFNGVYGNDIANANLSQFGFPNSGTNAIKASYVDAWREDSPSTTYPRIGWNYNRTEFMDMMVEKGSYLRLNNVTVGYDVPIRENSFVKNINIYFSGKNLFTVTNYSGYDPVVTSYMYNGSIMGVDWLGSPNSKSYLIGVNVTF